MKIRKPQLKSIITLFFLFISIHIFSQVSVGPKHIGKSSRFDKGVLDQFKNTTTIFVLSDNYDRSTYEQILKESWTVTPYKLVNYDDFSITNYLGEGYSIAQISGFIRTVSSNRVTRTSFFPYIEINMYDGEEIVKRANELSEKKFKKRFQRIIDGNSISIALFYLHTRDEFLNTRHLDRLYREDAFFNDNPGMLKNYFQKINQQLEKEQIYWMFGGDYLPEIKNLTSQKLYIPSYIGIKYNAWKGIDGEEDEGNIHDLLKNYDYDYEMIEENDLSNKILENEEFYYLRYVRVNAERFLQIINSKTGEIVYRDYMPGTSYRIKGKHISNINSKIKRASKK